MPTQDEKNWAIAAHIGALFAAFVSLGVLPFLVPLVILLIKREESNFIAHHARQALNFQLTCGLVSVFYLVLVLGGTLTIILIPATWLLACLGPSLFFIVMAILAVKAAIRANQGAPADYPAIPFLGDPE